MKKQQGMTFIGILFVGIILVFSAILVMKLIPPYIEYWSVKKVMDAIAKDPSLNNMSIREVRASFDKRASIDNITIIKGDDLDVSKDGGEMVASVEYPVKVPLFGNLSACMDFKATTASGTKRPALP